MTSFFTVLIGCYECHHVHAFFCSEFCLRAIFIVISITSGFSASNAFGTAYRVVTSGFRLLLLPFGKAYTDLLSIIKHENMQLLYSTDLSRLLIINS